MDKSDFMIEIDGSYGEGGGQILRTALSLSCLLRKPFRIRNIRKSRKKPGLMPQHLTAVRAAQGVCRADVLGDTIGSTELSFHPRKVKAGGVSFDIGTAGSTMLVLQTIIPALIFSPSTSTVALKGGTHVPFSPSFHYVSGVFAPFLRRLGISMDLRIESYGFYPKGGGMVKVRVHPAKKLRPIEAVERGKLLRLSGCSGVGNLPVSIAARQRDAMLGAMGSAIAATGCPVQIELVNAPTPGQGTFIFILAEFEHSLAGFASLGERGKSAEKVGEEAAMEFVDYYSSGAALDQHLSDQMVLYLALCGEPSEFTTSRVTQHLLTNLWVVLLFHEFEYSVEGETEKPGTVRIKGTGLDPAKGQI